MQPDLLSLALTNKQETKQNKTKGQQQQRQSKMEPKLIYLEAQDLAVASAEDFLDAL